MNTPKDFYIYKLEDDLWIFMTQVDRAKKEGTYSYFSSFEAAEKFYHDISLSQNPEWHKESCPVCAERVHGVTE